MVAMGSSSLSALAAATLLVSVAAEAIPTVTLPGYGNKMPLVSLGTGGFDIAQARNVTELALVQAGYRAIDTAHDYGCQKGVGAALIAAAKKGVPRDSVFLTTKVRHAVRDACRCRSAAADASRPQIPGCTVPAPFEPCHEANDWAATKALIAADLKMLKVRAPADADTMLTRFAAADDGCRRRRTSTFCSFTSRRSWAATFQPTARSSGASGPRWRAPSALSKPRPSASAVRLPLRSCSCLLRLPVRMLTKAELQTTARLA